MSAESTGSTSPSPLAALVGGRVELPLAARDKTCVGIARRVAGFYLDAWQLDEDLAYSVLLVISELLTNIHKHRRSEHALLMLAFFSGSVHLEIHDDAPIASVPTVREPLDTDEAGRGLLLVSALADEWGYAQREYGSVSSAEFKIPSAVELVA